MDWIARVTVEIETRAGDRITARAEFYSSAPPARMAMRPAPLAKTAPRVLVAPPPGRLPDVDALESEAIAACDQPELWEHADVSERDTERPPRRRAA